MYSHSEAMKGKGNSNYKHGSTGTPTFISWIDMFQRCYNPNNKDYKYYGGRGIRVCNSWIDNFGKFLRDMGFRPQGKTLDRIYGDRDYSKDNCRWATPKEQSQNRRKDYNKGEANSHAKLTRQDVIAIRCLGHSAKELAKYYQVSASTIHRIRAKRTWREV